MIIECVELTEKELEVLKGRCVYAYLNYNKSNYYERIVQYFLDLYGESYSSVLRCIVTNSSRVLKLNGDCLQLTRKAKHYSNNVQGIGYRKMIDIITKLEADGYINLYKGFYETKVDFLTGEVESDRGVCSIIEFTDLYKSLWEVSSYKKVKVSDFDPVVIRDRATKQDKSNKGFRGVSKMTNILNNYNKKLISSEFSLDGFSIPSPMYKRVFIDDLSKGGRFYDVASLQTMKSKYRPLIKIDKEDVSEYDFSALHPRLCYTLLGIDIGDFDPYGCDLGFLNVNEDKLKEIRSVIPDYNPTRNLVKYAMLCCLNAQAGNPNTASKAIGAISEKLGKDFKTQKENYLASKFYGIEQQGEPIPVGDVCRAILTHNKEISHFFYSDIGLSFQNTDSLIAEYIINHFLQLDEVVLSWHDGYLVKKSLGDELEDVMRKAYEHVLGTNINCKIKREY